MHQALDPLLESLYKTPMTALRGPFAFNEQVDLSGLIEAEKEERNRFAAIFYEGKDRFSTKWVG